IRDDELWAEDHPSWNEYLKTTAGELVGKSFTQAKIFIQAAEIDKRIPENIRPDVRPNMDASHYQELGRLVPKEGKKDAPGAAKDYSKLKPQTVNRVLNQAAKHATARNKDSTKPSVQDVRKAVDEELGIDRAAQAQETKRQREATA